MTMAKLQRDIGNGFITIDRSFVADQAKEAVRQFFKPITAALEQTNPPVQRATQKKPAQPRKRKG
jgi:hypothetical protein